MVICGQSRQTHLMLIVCGIVESNLGPCSDERVCPLFQHLRSSCKFGQVGSGWIKLCLGFS